MTGGCRSGKSRFALDYTNRSFLDRLYVATAEALDEEMKERIERHRAERGDSWRTREEPVDIGRVIAEEATKAEVILVDCITMWVSNMLLRDMAARDIAGRIEDLATLTRNAACSLVMVTNEVGAGIVPENRLARQFRDVVGTANQRLAACADEVYWLVAGVPVRIK